MTLLPVLREIRWPECDHGPDGACEHCCTWCRPWSLGHSCYFDNCGKQVEHGRVFCDGCVAYINSTIIVAVPGYPQEDGHSAYYDRRISTELHTALSKLRNTSNYGKAKL